MKGKDIFKIWAPMESKWAWWVRPVPFVSINSSFKVYDMGSFILPKVNYIDKLLLNTAIIVDLPGTDSVKEGIALAKLGFRPIPIYNGTIEQKGAIPTTDNNIVISGLIRGAYELEKIQINYDAPPAFLLDSNRTNRFKMNVSVFDNSWDIYPQDIPSAKHFINNGINNILIVGKTINKDLAKILYKFQNEGIKILFTAGYDEPKPVKIKRTRGKEKD